MTRYYCHNRECSIETFQKDDIEAECPLCKEPSQNAEEYENDCREEAEICRLEDEEHYRMYGCHEEDWQEMNYRPQLITNDAGEPIGWG